MTDTAIDSLFAAHQPGHALQREFYTSASIFDREFPGIFGKSWIYAGHRSQLPEIGSFFVFEFAGESLIIVRTATDEIRALLNVCRHRGSRVCTLPEGKVAQFVCPYHAWTYAIDGSLRAAPQFGKDFDAASHSLKQVRLVQFHGMLFVSFDPDATFDDIAADLDECLQPYDLAHTKIAKYQRYPIRANWKLAVENYCECYHCVPAHREFAVGHGRARPDETVADLRAEVMSRAESCGLSTKMVSASWADSVPVGTERYFDRYPMIKGQVTGSRTGRPVAPLLGRLTDYDGGASEFQVGIFSYALVYCDYAVIYRFIPVDVDNADCELVWLVNEDAREGKDYDVDELTWLWDVTTIADKRIIEGNARGVASRYFEPGPLAPMEYYTQSFIDWYIERLRE